MNIAIVGSRDYPHLDWVRSLVQGFYALHLLTGQTICIVSGGARGVDTAAELTAREVGLETLIFPAEWDRYGKSAGYRRNATIVEHADCVAAFWDGKSAGTRNTMEVATLAGKPVVWYGVTSEKPTLYTLYSAGNV